MITGIVIIAVSCLAIAACVLAMRYYGRPANDTVNVMIVEYTNDGDLKRIADAIEDAGCYVTAIDFSSGRERALGLSAPYAVFGVDADERRFADAAASVGHLDCVRSVNADRV